MAAIQILRRIQLTSLNMNTTAILTVKNATNTTQQISCSSPKKQLPAITIALQIRSYGVVIF